MRRAEAAERRAEAAERRAKYCYAGMLWAETRVQFHERQERQARADALHSHAMRLMEQKDRGVETRLYREIAALRDEVDRLRGRERR